MQESSFTIAAGWDDARMFLAVARAGQLLGAARTLGINQAILSGAWLRSKPRSGRSCSSAAPTAAT